MNKVLNKTKLVFCLFLKELLTIFSWTDLLVYQLVLGLGMVSSITKPDLLISRAICTVHRTTIPLLNWLQNGTGSMVKTTYSHCVLVPCYNKFNNIVSNEVAWNICMVSICLMPTDICTELSKILNLTINLCLLVDLML